MSALILAALLGGDAGHAEAFKEWVKAHPLMCEGHGCRIGCANGNKPHMACRDGKPIITCEPKPECPR